MSATGALSRTAPVASARPGSLAPGERVTWAPPIAFAALAVIAALRFADLLDNPPVWRALGIAAAGTATAAALHATRVPPRRALGVTPLRIALVALGAWLALSAAGASAAELWPWHWDRLAHTISSGLGAYDGGWPYRGGAAAARVTLMLGAAAGVVGAAALAFWPAPRPTPARTGAALVLLLTLYTTAAVNEGAAGWQVQGLLVGATAWLWVWAWWRPAPARAGRVTAWIVLASLAGLVAAGALRASTPLVDYRAWNPFAAAYPGAAFDWDQQYGPLDPLRSGEPMFEATSGAAHLWRVTTLDRFDGVAFVRSAVQPANTSGLITTPYRGRTVIARFTIRGLRSEQLLSPGQPVSVSISGVDLPRLQPIAPDGTIAVAAGAPTTGDTYVVTAFLADAAPAVLRRAPRTADPAFLPYTEFELPGGGLVAPSTPGRSPSGDAALARRIGASPYAGVFALARRLAAGAGTTYDIVTRVERYLQRNDIYSTDPPRGAYPIASFLLSSHVGYCQQFSGAMTLLLRMDGIPARVAAGFQSGTRAANGTWQVTGRDAHEWVEVYFAGVGWVPFDPTPASASGLPMQPALGVPRAGSGRSAAGASAGASRPGGAPAHAGAAVANHRRGAAGPVLEDAGLGLGALVLAVGLGLVLLVALSERRRRALGPSGEIAVAELAHALSVVGETVAPATTLAELEARLHRRYGAAASGYAALLRAGRYGREADAPAPSGADRRRLRRTLGARRDPLTRLRLLLILPPSPIVRGARAAKR